MPLIIADTDGELVYKSLSVKEKHARELLASISGSESKSGIFRIQNRRVFVREEFVFGKKRLFFMDFESLAERLGDGACGYAEFLYGAFDKGSRKTEISLNEVAKIFAKTAAPSVKETGVNIALRALGKNICITASVSALLLSLTFMVRAMCHEGKTVYIGVEEYFGSVRLFVESDGSDCTDEPYALTMLYEIATENGYMPQFSENADKKSISLMLSSPDVSLYGFKNFDSAYLKKVCEVCLEFII
ncbi:MAG: hypothetical protein IKU61_05255 [Clostridia bacterium]|nr:hypothetical protein [Clostridia bacterium]